MSDLLHTGWIQELDIPAALHRVPTERCAALYVLVSVIDSTPGVARLPSFVPLLDGLGAFHVEVDDDVVVGAATLIALADEHEFFSGFDEIWLCTEVPAAGKPGHLRITSDTPLGTEQQAALAEWMRSASCVAGLGDGDGLNFATFDPALAALWRP